MALNISAIRANNIAFRGNSEDEKGKVIVAENAAGVVGAGAFARSVSIIKKSNDIAKESGGALKVAKATAKLCKLSLLQRAEAFAGKLGLNRLVKWVKGPVAAKISGVVGGVLAVGVLAQDLTRTVSAAAGVVDANA